VIGRAVLASIAGFLVLVGLSAACYPGGTVFDPTAPGHHLLANYLCDLIQPTALNGAPNPVGARLAPVGMMLLGGGIVGGFWVAPALFPERRRLGRWTRGLGLASLAGLLAVPLTTTEGAGHWHSLAIFCAGVPAMAATVAGNVGLYAGGWRRLAALGAVLIVVGTVDGALYAVHLAAGGPPPLALPALQRIEMVLLLVWLVLITGGVRTGTASPSA
jgi:hypothetical protein